MPDAQENVSATDMVTNAVSEQLQLSGERDRLKNMLLEDLRSNGWTDAMFKTATREAATHQAKHDALGAGAAKSRQAITAHQLAHLIAESGHENVPDNVRARLLQRLVLSVRKFVSETGYQPSTLADDDDDGPSPAAQP